MQRTPEQIEADRKVQEAIDACRLAYGYNNSEILMEYVVVAAQQSFRDGKTHDSFIMLFRDGKIPISRAIGLLEVAKMTFNNDLRSVSDE